MRAAVAFLVGVGLALVSAAGLYVSPAIESLVPALRTVVLAGAAVAIVGLLWLGSSGHTTGTRRQQWRRAAIVWFPLGLVAGCLTAGATLVTLLAVYAEV